MDGSNISGLISGLLQNPSMLDGVLGLLTNMTSNSRDNSDQPENTENNDTKAENAPSDAQNAFSMLSGIANSEKTQKDDSPARRKALLLALKPFLCKERCEKIDFILNVLTLLDMAQGLGITNIKF